MKKNSAILIICSIFVAVYVTLSLSLTPVKNSVFWIGFGFAVSSVAIIWIITAISASEKSSDIPIVLSIITFSCVYEAAVIGVNIIFGYMLKVTANIFVSIHIVLLALFAVITLLMYLIKSNVIKQNSVADGKICEMQILIYEFEKIRTKLMDMQGGPRKEAVALMDSMLDELRFSEFGSSIDVSDIDRKLRSEAESLSAEIDNLILINSDDISSMESMINDIKKTIADKNMQIRLMSNNV